MILFSSSCKLLYLQNKIFLSTKHELLLSSDNLGSLWDKKLLELMWLASLIGEKGVAQQRVGGRIASVVDMIHTKITCA